LVAGLNVVRDFRWDRRSDADGCSGYELHDGLTRTIAGALGCLGLFDLKEDDFIAGATELTEGRYRRLRVLGSIERDKDSLHL
jgi:hypothetical protein